MYKKIDNKDIKYLKSLFEEGYALFGSEISKDYGHDELGTVANMPDALVFVRSAEEVSKVISEIMGCDVSHVSLEINEVEKTDWKSKVWDKEIEPNMDKLYVKPGYKPEK